LPVTEGQTKFHVVEGFVGQTTDGGGIGVRPRVRIETRGGKKRSGTAFIWGAWGEKRGEDRRVSETEQNITGEPSQSIITTGGKALSREGKEGRVSFVKFGNTVGHEVQAQLLKSKGAKKERQDQRMKESAAGASFR